MLECSQPEWSKYRFSFSCDEISGQKQLRKVLFWLGGWRRVCYGVRVGRSELQVLRAAGHIVSAVREKQTQDARGCVGVSGCVRTCVCVCCVCICSCMCVHVHICMREKITLGVDRLLPSGS